MGRTDSYFHVWFLKITCANCPGFTESNICLIQAHSIFIAPWSIILRHIVLTLVKAKCSLFSEPLLILSFLWLYPWCFLYLEHLSSLARTPYEICIYWISSSFLILPVESEVWLLSINLHFQSTVQFAVVNKTVYNIQALYDYCCYPSTRRVSLESLHSHSTPIHHSWPG